MNAWIAVYQIVDKVTGASKRMEYMVLALVASDVPQVIRAAMNFDGSEVVDVEIKRVNSPAVLRAREL
jgi:hypothetical protein